MALLHRGRADQSCLVRATALTPVKYRTMNSLLLSHVALIIRTDLSDHQAPAAENASAAGEGEPMFLGARSKRNTASYSGTVLSRPKLTHADM